MRPNDIENWALTVIERVESHQPVEDSRIELKSEWPKDYNKAARRIAGHANAARGEPILWLIGIDEKGAMVTGADYEEISNWKQSIESNFDERFAPTLTHINVPYKGKTVVALLWETDRSPFLVKTLESGPISLEVPWRDAASTRSAKRTDLLKMLYPVSKIPSFEVLKGGLDISTEERDSIGSILCRGGLFLDIYIVPISEARVVIPYHKCEAILRFIESGFSININTIWFTSSSLAIPTIICSTKPSSTISCTSTEVIIDGPGMATIRTGNPSISPDDKSFICGEIEVTIRMLPVDIDTPVVITNKLKQTEAPKGAFGRWVVYKYG